MNENKCLQQNRQDLASLFKEYPQTDAEKEVRDWLRNCKDVFAQNWTPDEVAHLAIKLGFDIGAVCSVLSHWNAAKTGSRIERMIALNDYRLESAMNEFNEMQRKLDTAPGLDLQPQWDALNQFLYEGIEFTEAA